MKYSYGSEIYDSYKEARYDALDALEENFNNIASDYFISHPELTLGILDELGRTGNPLYDKMIIGMTKEYLTKVIKEC